MSQTDENQGVAEPGEKVAAAAESGGGVPPDKSQPKISEKICLVGLIAAVAMTAAIAVDYVIQAILLENSIIVVFSVDNDVFTFVVSVLTAIAVIAEAIAVTVLMMPSMRDNKSMAKKIFYAAIGLPICLSILWFIAFLVYAIRDQYYDPLNCKGKLLVCTVFRQHFKGRDILRAITFIALSAVTAFSTAFSQYKAGLFS